MTASTGRLLASGRAADVFEEAPGLVRRRYRDGRSCEAEGAVMGYARAHGFPVPEVIEASGSDIVMERIEGPSMLEDLARRPWRLRAHAGLLAELHGSLHEIAAPGWLDAVFGEARALLHLDLHPENVIVTPAGPVVIDWSNAAAGPPLADIAQTWVLIASSLVPGSPWQRAAGRLGRNLFLGAFLRHFERAEVVAYLPRLARSRLVDENVRERERRVLRRMLEDAGSS